MARPGPVQAIAYGLGVVFFLVTCAFRLHPEHTALVYALQLVGVFLLWSVTAAAIAGILAWMGGRGRRGFLAMHAWIFFSFGLVNVGWILLQLVL